MATAYSGKGAPASGIFETRSELINEICYLGYMTDLGHGKISERVGVAYTTSLDLYKAHVIQWLSENGNPAPFSATRYIWGRSKQDAIKTARGDLNWKRSDKLLDGFIDDNGAHVMPIIHPSNLFGAVDGAIVYKLEKADFFGDYPTHLAIREIIKKKHLKVVDPFTRQDLVELNY
jgi:hypothetical protein